MMRKVPDSVNEIIQLIILDSASGEELGRLGDLLKYEMDDHPIANYLLDLEMPVLSVQFITFLDILSRHHKKIYAELEKLANKNNPQALFYLANLRFRKSENAADALGISYLERAAKLEHKPSKCLLNEKQANPDPALLAELYKCRHEQDLREMGAMDRLNRKQAEDIEELKKLLEASQARVKKLEKKLGHSPSSLAEANLSTASRSKSGASSQKDWQELPSTGERKSHPEGAASSVERKAKNPTIEERGSAGVFQSESVKRRKEEPSKMPLKEDKKGDEEEYQCSLSLLDIL